jgi:hypothetical protein
MKGNPFVGNWPKALVFDFCSQITPNSTAVYAPVSFSLEMPAELTRLLDNRPSHARVHGLANVLTALMNDSSIRVTASTSPSDAARR